MKCEKSGNHTISYQSLLLSTTVLNDILKSKTKFKLVAIGILKTGTKTKLNCCT